MAPNPSLDGKHAVFGEVLIGLEVLEALNSLAHGKEGHNVTSAATIHDAGQIRNGTVRPQLSQVATEGTTNEGGTNRNSRVIPEHRELRLNESLPLVYFDVEIKGELMGRIEMVLFTDTSPRHAENFRQGPNGLRVSSMDRIFCVPAYQCDQRSLSLVKFYTSCQAVVYRRGGCCQESQAWRSNDLFLQGMHMYGDCLFIFALLLKDCEELNCLNYDSAAQSAPCFALLPSSFLKLRGPSFIEL